MDVNELPLQELFTRLREAGLPLGIDEYQSVLRAMQAGFGMSDKAALKRLCQTLWIKSAEEKRLFEYHFKQVMGDVLPNLTTQSRRRKISAITRYLILGFLGVGIVLAVKSSSKEQIQENTSTLKAPTVVPSNSPIIVGTQTVTLIPTPTQKPQSNPNANQPNLMFWTLLLVLLSIIALSASYVLFRWVAKQRSAQQRGNSLVEPNIAPNPMPTSTLPAELTQTIKDEVQVAQAVLQATSKNEKTFDSRFILTTEYFPVHERQMKQIWRYLRRPVREGAATEFDVEATVNQIGRRGLLLEPVLVPPRVNRAEMLLLIDQDGSMVPFDALSRRLAETALLGGRLGSPGIYYFHNCPIEYLYRDPNHQEAELVSNVVTHVCSERTAVLIFSDAGAARGGYSEERYELTKEFLAKLKQRVRYVAWLNPMPKKRWHKTTAGEIAHLVPMFELSRRGMQDAIGVLRGRPTNFEGRRV